MILHLNLPFKKGNPFLSATFYSVKMMQLDFTIIRQIIRMTTDFNQPEHSKRHGFQIFCA